MTATTAEQIREQLALPRIDQIGFVVPDIERAMASYEALFGPCLLYTSPSPRDRTRSRMPSSA